MVSRLENFSENSSLEISKLFFVDLQSEIKSWHMVGRVVPGPPWTREPWYFVVVGNILVQVTSADFDIGDFENFLVENRILCGRVPTVKLKIQGKAFLKSMIFEHHLYFSQFFHGSGFGKSQPLPLVYS